MATPSARRAGLTGRASWVVVTFVPRPRNAAGDEPWRAAVPAFREEALFQEFSVDLRINESRARREE